jgi:ELWxxDGT repeat protein
MSHRHDRRSRKLRVERLESREMLAGDFTLVKDVLSIPDNGAQSRPDDFVQIDGLLYFSAHSTDHGRELWRTDGTESGTILVRDIQPGVWGANPRNLVNVNGTLFFSANDGLTGYDLWKSDGTAAGTVKVKDLEGVC